MKGGTTTDRQHSREGNSACDAYRSQPTTKDFHRRFLPGFCAMQIG
jgi:hypothetical protein